MAAESSGRRPRATASGSTERPLSARVPPHNLEAEASLLGAMLLSRDAVAAAIEAVNGEDFYKPAHSHVFDAITNLYGAGQPADPVTVAEELRRAGLLEALGGADLLIGLQSATPSIGNAARYAHIVEEHALLRKLIRVAGEIAEIGYELPEDVGKAVDRAESMMFEVAQKRVTDSTHDLRRLLGDALDELERKFQAGSTITGLASGYSDLDELLSGLQPSALLVVGARPSMGKCVAWDTLILDPATGALHTAEELCVRGSQGAWVQVPSLGDDGHLDVVEPSAFIDDGVKPVFEVRTRTGRTIRTTASHPFLTRRGWQPLRDLLPGVGVAVPRQLPWFGDDRLPAADVIVLAHVLATGTTARDVELMDRCLELGLDMTALVEQHGLDGTPDTFAIPPAVLRLPREQVLAFVRRVLETNRPRWGDEPDVAFTFANPTIARGMQHLLLRFGVLGAVDGVDLRLPGDAWADAVATLQVGALVGGGSTSARRGAGQNVAVPEPGSDIAWDEIVAITPAGDDRVFDLTIPVLHNFVAADIVVHNTAFGLGMATHAAVHEQKPVLFFSLEMGHRELTQRILASDARVDSVRMRSGDLREDDWSKLIKAIGRLEDKPLYIDDNPQVTVMEIRAKARRLKSRLGQLGLIVVDYLQLMTGRTSAENRQVEVSEISRGLKILARELEVPVVALSQLSRALELRADKRPMLADLRESGSIEQDADVVMFIYRDEVYNSESPDRGIAEVIVAKHRNGPTGTKRLAFIGNYTRFANMARGV